MKNNLKHITIHAIAFSALLTIMFVINYINLPVVITIYLPIFIIYSLLILFKKQYTGNIFLVSAELGLTVEYIMHLINVDNPNMIGASLNIVILTIGLIVGIIVQIYKSKNT